MNTAAVLLALHLVQLTGPGGQVILLDANKVTTLREPRGMTSGHFPSETRCIVFTDDGNQSQVAETCAQVRKMLEEAR